MLGSGTVTVGLAPTDKAQFYMGPGTYSAGVGSTVLNDFVFNTAAGTDAAAGVLLNATEAIFAGTIVSDQASASFATGSIVTNSVAVLTGRVTSTGAGGGLWLRNTGQTPGVTVRLANQTGTANDYRGTTTIEANTTLALGAADQVPNGSGKGDVDVAGSVRLGGFSETINGLSGSGFVDGVSGTPTLTVGDGDATATFSGVIGNTSGSLSLAKIGSGVQTLAGANTLSGSSDDPAGHPPTRPRVGPRCQHNHPARRRHLTLAPYLQTTVGGLDPQRGRPHRRRQRHDHGGERPVGGEHALRDPAGYNGGSVDRHDRHHLEHRRGHAAGGTVRAVGWLDNGGGSVTFAFAAPGDVNLDGLIDVLDAATLPFGRQGSTTRPSGARATSTTTGSTTISTTRCSSRRACSTPAPTTPRRGPPGPSPRFPNRAPAVVSVACLAGAAAVFRLRHRGRRCVATPGYDIAGSLPGGVTVAQGILVPFV